MIHGIYTIKNLITSQLYVGSAIDPPHRWRTHKSYLNKNKHENPKLQNSWNKYGEKNFKFQVEEIVENKKDLIKIEQQWLDSLWSMLNLFNICKTAGSTLGRTASEQTKRKISVSTRNALTGKKRKPFSEEWKKKLSLSRLGSKRTEEQKQRMSQAAFKTWKNRKFRNGKKDQPITAN